MGFAGVPMGFHCFPGLRHAYIVLATICCAVMAACVIAVPKRYSTTISVVLILGSVPAAIPATHWLFVSTAGRKGAGNSLVLSIGMLLTAAVVFMRYWPECSAPGRFDLYFNSHQIWHVLVFFGIAKYADALTTVFALTGTAE